MIFIGHLRCVFLKKSEKNLFLSIISLIIGVLGLIFLTTTAMISDYNDSDNWFRIFFDGRTKRKIGGVTISVMDNDFPMAFTVLTVIGISLIILASFYWFGHALGKKNNCFITNYRLPGPLVGTSMVLGGLLGFIGSMVFLPYGNDIVDGSSSYAFGYISITVILGLFLLIGLLIIFTSKKGRKRRK